MISQWKLVRKSGLTLPICSKAQCTGRVQKSSTLIASIHPTLTQKPPQAPSATNSALFHLAVAKEFVLGRLSRRTSSGWPPLSCPKASILNLQRKASTTLTTCQCKCLVWVTNLRFPWSSQSTKENKSRLHQRPDWPDWQADPETSSNRFKMELEYKLQHLTWLNHHFDN